MSHPATSDCEHASSRFGQPTNTLSSLAMAGIGLALEQRARKSGPHARSERWVGAALAAAGFGSAAYHGPTKSGHWLHDVTLLAPAATMAIASEGELRGHDQNRTAIMLLATMAVLAAGRMRGPHVQDALSVAAASALGLAILRRVRSESDHRPEWLATGGALGGAGAVAFALSRTDGPMCDPHSRMQGHGLWHVLIAGAVVATAKGLDLLHPRTDAT